MHNQNNKKAFTMVELMVVVIIIGVIAGFAIPNYQKSVERAYERDAIINLTTFHGANQIYRAQNGQYWPNGSNLNVATINTNLGLNIIENGMTFTASGDGTTFTARAVRWGPATTFTVTVTQATLTPTNPDCTLGACP